MNTIALWLAIAVLTPSPATLRIETLDYVNPGCTLKIALQSISALGGTQLTVSGSMADEIVVLRLVKADRGEFEQKLAETFRAEWQAEAGGKRLIRSATTLRQIQLDHLALNRARFGKSLEQFNKEFERVKPILEADSEEAARKLIELQKRDGQNPKQWEEVEAIQRGFPAEQMIRKLLAMVDHDVVARLETGERAVFSTVPNAMQAPLAKGALESVGSAMAEQLKISERLNGVIDEDDMDWVMEGLSRFKPQDRISKALLIVTKPQFGYGYSVELKVANQKGIVVYDGSEYLQDGLETDLREAFRPNPSSNELKEQPMTLNATQNAFLELMQKANQGRGRPREIPEPLKRAFADPIKLDPLSFSFGDYLIALAALEGKNVVAKPTDMLGMFGVYASMQGAPKPTTIRRVLGLSMMKSKINSDEKWIQVWPKDFVEDKSDHLPRRTLFDIMKELSTKRKLRLDDWANLAARTPDDPTKKPLFMFVPLLFSNTDEDQEVFEDQWSQLRFYGLLNSNQRADLVAGKALVFGSLSQEQRAAISRIVYIDDPSLEPSNEAYSHFRSVESGEVQLHNSILTEVTELIPNGVPFDSLVKLTGTNREGFFMEYSYEGRKDSMFASDDEVAWFMFQKENPEEADSWENKIVIEGYRPGAHRTLEFILKVGRSFQKSWALNDEIRDVASRLLRFEDLPQEFRTSVMKKIEQLKKEHREPPPQFILP